MRLKSVRIIGFKTFAEKVELNLDVDIIAIVGPNGCGKSNIVDAILWGLGEPNARNLRASSGVDVIFNGSQRRKALGYAEVTLHFDNEDGTLPLEAAEVAITRKINRAGESHFSINRRTCRLKDIYDLLADSGLGRAGYSIVGQSEIDQALSASPEERRAWIDEAAGVQRFRSKRVESLRRLEAAKDHLSRIEQILSDISFQREPLREQAEVAKRFLEIKAALAELEVNLLVKELQGSQSELDRIEAARVETEDALLSATERAQATRKLMDAQGADLAEIERRLDAERELRQAEISKIEKAESSIALAKQRLDSLDELEQDINGAQGESANLIRDAEAELAILEIEYASAAEELCKQGGIDFSAQTQELRGKLQAIEAQISQARKAEMEELKREAQVNQSKLRLQRIETEAKGIEEALADLATAIVPAEVRLRDLTEKTEALRAEVSLVQSQRAQSQAEAADVQKELQRVLSESSMLEGRRRGIESTIETMDGLGQGAKAVLDLCRSGRLSGSFTPVSSAIEVSERYAMAIETALGAAAHDLITPHDSEAKAAIQLLKAQSLGRATFQPLNLVNPGSSQARGIKGAGVIGVAADLVRCQSEHRSVIESLLGRIVIVESLDDSIRLVGTRGWSRMVTLDGEVMHSGGSVTGGRNSRQGSGLVQRRAELATVVHRLEGLATENQSLVARYEALTGEIEAIANKEAESLRSLSETQDELAEAKEWHQQLQRESASTEREREKLAREQAEIQVVDSVEPEQEWDLAALNRDRDRTLGELVKVTAEEDQQRTKTEKLDSQLSTADQRRQAAKDRLERALSGVTTRAERLSGLSEERQSWEERIQVAEAERIQAEDRAEHLRLQLEATHGQRKDLLETGLKLAEDAKDAEHSMSALSALANKLEVEMARCESRRATADQRLLEDYSISRDEALLRPIGEIPDDAQSLVSRLRRDLRALGDVNVGSIEAYDRLSDRFIELDAQREDVQAGMDELHGAVKELDRLTRDRFLNTFEQVRSMFSQTFSELFGGGEAELALTNVDEIISAGVQVNVTIPGKKRQRLELLSGGERSMSAIAFLFALLRVKSSPLVVLDEVDAPLDGRNVERFVEVLNTFRGSTQFLVITHNPVTIEAAPLWFGVTMQEPGCTSILPYSVPEEVVSEQQLQSANSL
ncbi:MAG: chromosome segregation protein SMC [Chthonomonas sp.]|nr:chromosome segregation protein SMC [Chthonomonas sp.]